MRKHLVVPCAVISILVSLCTSLYAQWTQTNGPYGGSIYGFASDGEKIFASARSSNSGGSLFVSVDDGFTWSPVSTPWKAGYSVTSLVASGTRLFALTGSIFFSDNGGATWTKSQDTSWVSGSPTCLAANNSMLFAGIGTYSFSPNQGVYRSTDNGESWSAAGNGLTDNHVHAIASSADLVFAGTSHGLFVSSDQGSNWRIVDTARRLAINSVTIIGSTVLAGVYKSGIRRSSDNGLTWISVYPGVTDSTYGSFAQIGSNLFVCSGQRIYRSNDTGATWSPTSAQPNHPGYITAMSAVGSNLLIGTSWGAYISKDLGASWKDISSNMISAGANYLAVNPLDSLLYASLSGGGAWISSNNGQSWQQADSGYLAPQSVLRSNGVLLAMTDKLYLSTDNGLTWIRSADSGLQQWDGLRGELALVGNDLFAATKMSGICRSTDNGAHWTPVNTGMWSDDSAHADRIAVVGNTLFTTAWSNIYRSTNRGERWELADTGLSPYNYIEDMTVKDETIFLTIIGSIYRSTNYGDTWEHLAGYPEDAMPQQILLQGSDILIVAGDIYRSTDDGTTWSTIDTGHNVRALAIKDQFAFVGMDSVGIWRRPLSELLGSSGVPPTAVASSTLTCYPNPSSGSTKIIVSPSTSGRAEILIVNQLGVEVAHLFSGQLVAGPHSFTWRRSPSLPDGVYHCVLRMGSQMQTTPVVLLH